MMDEKKIVRASLLLLILPLGVTIYALVHRTPAKPHVVFHQQAATQVIAALESGILKADANGIVTLPPQWKGITKDGWVYVTRNKSGIAEVLFPTYRTAIGTGTNADFGGYLYSRALLQSGDPKTQAGPNDYGWMPLVSPQPLPFEPRWPGTAGRSEVFVCRKLGSHWYEACTENNSE